jgi:hypothetical protein
MSSGRNPWKPLLDWPLWGNLLDKIWGSSRTKLSTLMLWNSVVWWGWLGKRAKKQFGGIYLHLQSNLFNESPCSTRFWFYRCSTLKHFSNINWTTQLSFFTGEMWLAQSHRAPEPVLSCTFVLYCLSLTEGCCYYCVLNTGEGNTPPVPTHFVLTTALILKLLWPLSFRPPRCSVARDVTRVTWQGGTEIAFTLGPKESTLLPFLLYCPSVKNTFLSSTGR